MTFYENVEVGPPTKSNPGAPNETVITPLVGVRCREMYTESTSRSVRKLYITQTHNKHAGPYTCAALDQLQRRVVHRTITLLLYRKIIIQPRINVL